MGKIFIAIGIAFMLSGIIKIIIALIALRREKNERK